MEEKKFKLHKVIQCLQVINTNLNKQKQVPIRPLCQMLEEYCIVFNELNSMLGLAFSDVQSKVGIIKENQNKIQGFNRGFFQFIQMEIQKNIHIFNGSNNSKLKAPKQYHQYNSTARNLLRMMWLLTFIRVTFQQCLSKPANTKLSTIFTQAYDMAFGQKHNWVLRNSAKLAIKTSSDRTKLVIAIMGSSNQQKFQDANAKFLKLFIPVHQALWGFYKKNKLINLQ